MITEQTTLDVLIVGGGLTGAVLALALTQADATLRIGLLETARPNPDAAPEFDERVLALSEGSRRLLVQLDVWSALQNDACPIEHIHVSDRGQFGRALLHAREHGVAALGQVIALRVLGRALQARLSECAAVSRLFGNVTQLQQHADSVSLQIQSEQAVSALQACVVLAADGGPSSLRALAGLPVAIDDYQQSAVITTVRADRPHQYWAYERFTQTGPLALLPMTQDRWSLVWTQTPAEASRLLRIGEAEFLAALQQAFGWRVGKFVQLGAREKFDLKRVRSLVRRQGNVLLMGNAATTLHPIAGQGFNLALRDAMAFAKQFAGSLNGAAPHSLTAALDHFVGTRAADAHHVAQITDSLVRLFSNDFPLLSPLRGAALSVLDVVAPLKRQMTKQAMGLVNQERAT